MGPPRARLRERSRAELGRSNNAQGLPGCFVLVARSLAMETHAVSHANCSSSAAAKLANGASWMPAASEKLCAMVAQTIASNRQS